jgi:hypothetical protein
MFHSIPVPLNFFGYFLWRFLEEGERYTLQALNSIIIKTSFSKLPHLVDSERCNGRDALLCLGLSVVVTCSSDVLGKWGSEYVS